MIIGFVIFPDMTLLDLAGPLEVFSKMQGAEVHVLWKTLDPVPAEGRSFAGKVQMTPTTTFADCPNLDLICIPGGPGQIDIMDDEELLSFVRRQGEQAKWVTSVCTGSLVLAAAGLLEGYRATSHWMSRDQLALFGAIPTAGRVVMDRNRITGGGVTAGIDFALTVLGEILGHEAAIRLMLAIEYAPAPPFGGGDPETAPAELVDAVRTRASALLERRRKASEVAAKKL